MEKIGKEQIWKKRVRVRVRLYIIKDRVRQGLICVSKS